MAEKRRGKGKKPETSKKREGKFGSEEMRKGAVARERKFQTLFPPSSKKVITDARRGVARYLPLAVAAVEEDSTDYRVGERGRPVAVVNIRGPKRMIEKAISPRHHHAVCTK